MTARFGIVASVVLTAAVAAAIWIGTLQFQTVSGATLPMAPARSGEFVAVIRTRGQIEAERSFPIYAPLVQDLRIAWMASPSEIIKEGEPIIRFDSSVAERDLIQRRAAAERARAALDRAVVEGKAAAEHDERELVDARLGVEVAKLNTADSEFVSRVTVDAA